MRRFDADFKINNMFLLKLEDIVIPSDLQGRAFDPDVNELKESIKTHGQLQPVTVRKDAKDRPVLVFGFSRVRAIRELNEESGGEAIRVKAVLASCNEEEAFLQNLEENFRRNAVSPIDTAHNIRRLKDRFGKTDAEIGKIYGKSASWVASHIPLMSLGRAIAWKVHTGELSMNAALALCKVDEDKREAVLEKAAQAEASNSAGLKEGQYRVGQRVFNKDDKSGKEKKQRISHAAVVEAANVENGGGPVARAAFKPKMSNVISLLVEWDLPGFLELDQYIAGRLTYDEVCEKLMAIKDRLMFKAAAPKSRRGKDVNKRLEELMKARKALAEKRAKKSATANSMSSARFEALAKARKAIAEARARQALKRTEEPAAAQLAIGDRFRSKDNPSNVVRVVELPPDDASDEYRVIFETGKRAGKTEIWLGSQLDGDVFERIREDDTSAPAPALEEAIP